MVTAVCLQEWQFSLWGGTVLNYSIQIYTELSEIIGITYVNSDGGRQPVLKGVITIISSYFGPVFETVWPVFMSVSPWSDWESSLERFQRIWVTFSGYAAAYCFSIRMKCRFTLPLAEWESSGRVYLYICSTYSHTHSPGARTHT